MWKLQYQKEVGSTNEELRGDPLHESTETEKQNKKRESKEVQRDISHELLHWLQEFREHLVDESTSEQTSGNQSKEVKTLPSHLMNFRWSREHTWNRVRVSTVYLRTFRRIQIVKFA